MTKVLEGQGVGARLAQLGSWIVIAGLLLACMQRVEGERAQTGECPEGEVCSAATPDGLDFVGHAFWDDSQSLRLGPVLVGGTFDVGIDALGKAELPGLAFEAEDPAVFAVAQGEGPFGPLLDGEPIYAVDGHFTLTAKSAGTTMIRVVDPSTGELFDRIAIEAYAVEDISITNMNDPERDYLLEGCEELLALRLLAKSGSRELRAFDQSVQLRADGLVRAEEDFWDCFAYTAPKGRVEVEVEVVAGGKSFTRALEVRTLAQEKLSSCPQPRRRD